MSLDAALERARDYREGDVAQFFDELRIASVATEPSHRADTLANAEWLVERLGAAGFAAGGTASKELGADR